MATYQTYQQVGIKEDISNIIKNISPTKTPFMSSIANEKIHNVLFQWQEDSLRAVNGTSAAIVQGADATFITVNPTVMRSNYTQIFMEAVVVAGTTDAVSTYGRARESAYQLAKSAAQLKRDLENAFVGTAQTSNSGNATTAALMAGYQAQIDASTKVSITAANIDETHLQTCLQDIYTNGADPTVIQVTPSNSLVLQSFATSTGRQRQTAEPGASKLNVVVAGVGIYVSPFGEQKVVVNRFLAAKNTLVFEPDMWSQATLRPWTRETLAKTGDALKMMIVGEFSLKHKNFKASGLILDNQ